MGFFHRIGRTQSAVMAMAALTLFACTRDENGLLPDSGSDAIRFQVEKVTSWQALNPTRSSEQLSGESAPAFGKALRLSGENPADSLFLHPGISDLEGVLDLSSAASSQDALLQAEKQTLTRATPVATESFYESIGVLSYLYSGDWLETLTPNYFYNLEVTQDSDWTTQYHWPNDERKIRFFAYAPYNCSGLTLSPATAQGTPSFSYTVPSAVSAQVDLVAAATAGQTGKSVTGATPLDFYHALTAVRFITGDTMPGMTIKKVTLKNICSEGTHVLGTDSWTISTPANFEQSLSYTVTGPNLDVITGSATFMMLPQTLSEGAEIEIQREDPFTNQTQVLTASIAANEWPIGKTVTYIISTSSADPTLVPIFTVSPPKYTYAAGDYTYEVTSYGSVQGTETTYPIAWTAEFVEEDGNGGYTPITQPEWITSFVPSGPGSVSGPEVLNSTILTQTPDLEHTSDPLSGIPAVSNYDLSTKGGTTPVNTANCYIVGAPGSYNLPLVYGNAIKNGVKNEGSYKTTNDYITVWRLKSDQRLLNFKNHRGADITDPYIYNNAQCVPASATLVWQDTPDLVTDVALSDEITLPDNTNVFSKLTFKVGEMEGSFKQGNAIVAVRNAAKEIMWSWHIWVTVYDPVMDHPVTNTKGQTVTMMSANLGWSSYQVNAYYPARGVKVKFTQVGTGEVCVVDFASNPYAALGKSGNSIYYQWGRKDPMLPQIHNPAYPETSLYKYIDKPCYYVTDGNISYQWTNVLQTTPIMYKTISKPHEFYSANGTRWSTDQYANLWCMENTKQPYESELPASQRSTLTDLLDISGTKTIYDPSPFGYKVPPADVYDAFTLNSICIRNPYPDNKWPNTTVFEFGAQQVANTPYTSSTEAELNEGFEFYCRPMSSPGHFDISGGTMFFPQTGYRTGSGGMQIDEDQVGVYWTSQSTSEGDGSTMRFDSSSPGAISPNNNWKNGKAYAYAVRAIRDE